MTTIIKGFETLDELKALKEGSHEHICITRFTRDQAGNMQADPKIYDWYTADDAFKSQFLGLVIDCPGGEYGCTVILERPKDGYYLQFRTCERVEKFERERIDAKVLTLVDTA